MKQIKIVENDVEAKKSVVQLLNQGFKKEEVYILAHDKDRSNLLTDATNTNDKSQKETGEYLEISQMHVSRLQKKLFKNYERHSAKMMPIQE